MSAAEPRMSYMESLSGMVTPATAGAVSFVSTLSVAAGAAPVPAELPSWLPYLTTILGPLLIFVMGRVLAALAAQKRSLAAAKLKRANELKSDKNPGNDAEAAKLEDQAAADTALADALEALKVARKD